MTFRREADLRNPKKNFHEIIKKSTNKVKANLRKSLLVTKVVIK